MDKLDIYRLLTAVGLGSIGGFCKNLMELGEREKLKVSALFISTLVGAVCGLIAFLAGDYYKLSFALVGLIAIVGGLMGKQFINQVTEKASEKIDSNE